MNIRVRPATQADVPQLVTLIGSIDMHAGSLGGKALGEAGPEALAERLSAMLENGRVLLVAADEAGSVGGVLAARFDSVGALDLTPVVHVTHLLVATSMRRRGIARSLLAACVHLAEEQNVEHVVITAMSGARESNRYLARLGFAPMVVHRMAPTSALRRTLGMADPGGRVAVLRRARLIRAQRAGASSGVSRGA